MHSQVRSGPGAAGEEIQADLPLQLNHVQNKPAKREMNFLSIAVILSLELKSVWHLLRVYSGKRLLKQG